MYQVSVQRPTSPNNAHAQPPKCWYDIARKLISKTTKQINIKIFAQYWDHKNVSSYAILGLWRRNKSNMADRHHVENCIAISHRKVIKFWRNLVHNELYRPTIITRPNMKIFRIQNDGRPRSWKSLDLDGRSSPATWLTVRNLVKRTETENGGQNGGVTEKKPKI